MGGVWLRVRTQARSRLAATLALITFVGLTGGVVLAAFAGARRTDAAVPAFLAYSGGLDAVIYLTGPKEPSPDLRREFRLVTRMPQVASASRYSAPLVSGRKPGDARSNVNVPPLALDTGGLAIAGRPIIVTGRLVDERRPDEVMVDEEFASKNHVGVGNRYLVRAFSSDQFDAVSNGATEGKGPVADTVVVGIVRMPQDLIVNPPQDSIYGGNSELYLTPAWWQKYGPDVASYGMGIGVRLKSGPADLAAFRRSVRDQFAKNATVVDPRGDAQLGAVETPGVRRATGLQSRALQAFGALFGLALVVIIGQTIIRQLAVESRDEAALRAVGMTTRQMRAVSVLRSLLIVIPGVVLAVVVGIALSPLAPLAGTVGRRAEVHLGIRADWFVLITGAAVLAVLLTGIAGARRRKARTVRRSVSSLDKVLARVRPVTARVGSKYALAPGPGSLPVRSAIAASAAALMFAAATTVFVTSIDHVVGTPAAYGAAWDVAVGGYGSAQQSADGARRVAKVDGLAAWSGAGIGSISVNRREVSTLAIRNDRGWVLPPVIEGRAPTRVGEIGLASETMHDLQVGIGDRVQLVRDNGPPRRFLVVGRMIPSSGGVDETISPGKGAVIAWPSLELLTPGVFKGENAVGPEVFLVRLDPGADRTQVLRTLAHRFPQRNTFPFAPPDVANVHSVRALAVALAVVMALLALGACTHAFATTLSRRRAEFAVLRTMGLKRAGSGATVLWQASAVVVTASVIGIPLGVAAGRFAWRITVSQLHIDAGPILPAWAPLALVAAGAVFVTAVALVPALWARHLHVANALRSE